jgi:speckle-type POZ protein
MCVLICFQRRALLVYPKGNSTEKGKSLSIYLKMEDFETLPCGRTTYAEYMLRVKDQLFGKHIEKKGQFTTSA